MIYIFKTRTLYLEDAYNKEEKTQILSINEELSGIELNESIIHPGGGGQPMDIAYINKTPILSTIESGSHLYYQIPPDELESFSINQNVKIKLDWEFRYAVMKLHSVQHILAAVILKKYGFKIAGNSIHPQKSHLDFETEKNFNQEEILEIEREVNRIIMDDIKITSENLPLIKIKKIIAVNRVRLDFLPDLNSYRVIKIGSFDMVPCGGTHIKSTGEIKAFFIIKYKSRGRRRKRFYYNIE
ncbi:MAG: alanyl-tRNA editing protein [Candidatus Heimdallarchaeota archaeon]|nr:alanyl-tRNA editing protein [Candidatus Heimdallarchaeota archaeon]